MTIAGNFSLSADALAAHATSVSPVRESAIHSCSTLSADALAAHAASTSPVRESAIHSCSTTRWSAEWFTDVGKVRPANQDRLLVESFDGHNGDDALGLFVVADGMGGPPAGDVAAQMTVDALQEAAAVYRTWAVYGEPETALANRSKTLAAGIVTANKRVLAHVAEYPACRGMGSTVSAVFLGRFIDRFTGLAGGIDGALTATVAHAGDSRVYLLRTVDGEHVARLHQLTVDDTLATAYARLGWSPAEIAFMYEPHALTKGVGVEDEIAPTVTSFAVFPGDVLLLCTDGVHGALTEAANRIACALLDSGAARDLMQKVLEGSAADNLTGIAVRILGGE